MRRRKPRSVGAVLRVCVIVIVPLTQMLFRRDWRHGERIPDTGPAIVVANHVSYADPFVMARFIWDSGRVPRFLAKSTLFSVPVVGYVLRSAAQIPVRRGTLDAAHSLDEAVSALAHGEVVVVYPEGTVTRDPDWWPTAGKTGAARLARLVPDVPVLPVGQWGSQNAVDWYHRRFSLLSRTNVGVSVGEPLDLRPFLDHPETAATLREMTVVMMTAITAQVAELRGRAAPPSAPSPSPPVDGMPA